MNMLHIYTWYTVFFLTDAMNRNNWSGGISSAQKFHNSPSSSFSFCWVGGGAILFNVAQTKYSVFRGIGNQFWEFSKTDYIYLSSQKYPNSDLRKTEFSFTPNLKQLNSSLSKAGSVSPMISIPIILPKKYSG